MSVLVQPFIYDPVTINIEDKSILPHLKKILSAIDGVSIAPTKKQKKCGLEEALEDVKEGRITHFENVDEMFASFGI